MIRAGKKKKALSEPLISQLKGGLQASAGGGGGRWGGGTDESGLLLFTSV